MHICPLHTVALDWVPASPSLHLGTQSRGPWLLLGSGSHPWPWDPRDIRSPVEGVHPAATAARGPCWPAPPRFPAAHSRLLLTAVSSCDQEQQSALEEARQPKNDNVVIPECAHGGLYIPDTKASADRGGSCSSDPAPLPTFLTGTSLSPRHQPRLHISRVPLRPGLDLIWRSEQPKGLEGWSSAQQGVQRTQHYTLDFGAEIGRASCRERV